VYTEPIVVMDGDNLLFFSSRTAAEEYLEAIDVEQGVYTGAFDADGNSLSLRVVDVEEKGLLGFGRVRVSHVRVEDAPKQFGEEGARHKLIAFLGRIDPTTSIESTASTRGLIRAAARRYGVR
jgi:hypothetical protein